MGCGARAAAFLFNCYCEQSLLFMKQPSHNDTEIFNVKHNFNLIHF